MDLPVVLTGLRANTELQLGNYFGALLPSIDIARNKSKDYKVQLFIPDLHSFTTPIDHTALHKNIMNNLRLFVAAGIPLDNDNVYIYRQSYIPAHSELAWILNCFVGVGELSRMTQFKDKSDELTKDRVSAGLFDYPVLMASDILLYDAEYVPVGEDQTQHLEFTRDLAMRINNKFNQQLFSIPHEVKKQHGFFGKDQGLRIMDLANPNKKMSKSAASNRGVIFLMDNPDEAYDKVMSATTDSQNIIAYNPKEQPGISNLLLISSLITQKSIDDLVGQYKEITSYSVLKKDVATQVKNFLSDLQNKYTNVDMELVNKKLASSENQLNLIANAKLQKIQKAVGIR